jgi:hypothetical protein
MLGLANAYRQEAEELERLANILSYGRDKERLRARAELLRALALQYEEAEAAGHRPNQTRNAEGHAAQSGM